MFRNGRYVTRGVTNEIPADLQLAMWNMIDSLRGSKKKLDYLQVFELQPVGGLQKIVHSQEVPKYQNEILCAVADGPVAAKIFVIDDGDHSTMMLAEEY